MHGLNFLTSQHDISTAYIAYYDNVLVLFSYLIACLAAYTAWTMASLYRAENHRYKKVLWMFGGGLVMGCGIWAMHFVAMLAYRLPIAVSYDLSITLLSMLPAIIASIIAISVIGQAKLTARHFIFGSVLFGIGIGSMHYVGMAAMRMNALMIYDPLIFAISLVVAIALAFVSLKLKFITEQFSSHQYYQSIKNCSILIMGTAVSGMHYTGMAAVYYFPITRIDTNLLVAKHTNLPAIVITISILIMILTIAIAMFENRLKNAISKIHTSRERMYEAIDSISDGFVMFDEADRLVLYNDNFKKMYQEIGEWIRPGVTYSELVEKRAQYADAHIGENPQQYINDKLKWHKDPESYFTETLNDGRHVFGKEQRAVSGDSVGVWTDISELKKAKNRLLQSNKQVQMLLDASPSPIIVRAVNDNEVLYFNDSAKAYFTKNHFDITLGSKNTFVSTRHLEALKQQIVCDGNVTNVEFDLSANDGTDYTVMLSATLISYDNKPSVLFSFVDISERKALEQKLRDLAQTDPLTRIYNRRYIMETGEKEIARCQRNKQQLTLLILDIDNFKVINDTYGHEMGDKSIIKITEICQYSIRDVDILGRLGGEEFVILLPDTDLRQAKTIAERIRFNVESNQMTSIDQQFSFTTCIGISSVLKAGEDNITDMIARADEKLYQAKHNGKNQVAW